LPLALLAVSASCHREQPGRVGPDGKVVLRIGHFPNVTHAQAMIAHGLSRKGKGWFEERLGRPVKIEWFVYNAGPSAMEAILAGSIDLTYVGPSPALNAYARSNGEDIRIIAGAAVGGAALVVKDQGPIKTPADFRGRKVATPQLGNTQDVACRFWLQEQGFQVNTTGGGDVLVLPTANPDQLSLFQQGKIDGAWTVEPWVSRLEMEAGGKVFLEEKDAVTTVLVSSAAFQRAQPELTRRIAEAHAALTEWINANPQEAKQLLQEELKAETTKDMPPPLLSRSWERIRLQSALNKSALEGFVFKAKKLGFLRDLLDLSDLVRKP
jgi:NitT/TauT family transport system substrate-binding protein